MVIIDKDLLAFFRRQGRCEWTGKRGPVDPNHIVPRGVGSGKRLDIRLNLIAMNRAAHDEYHAGQILQAELVLIVCQREKCLQRDWWSVMRWLRRLPKDPLPCQLEKALGELNRAARKMAEKTLAERSLG